MLRTTFLGLALGVSVGLWAQTPAFPVATANVTLDGPYQINYASNLDLGDGVINVTNTGASAGASTPLNGANMVGDICVNAYVYDLDQELATCCSCLVSPNSLHAWPVSFGPNALLANPSNLFAGEVIDKSHMVVIKLLATSAANGTCTNPALGATSSNGVTTTSLAYGMVAWGNRANPTGTSTVAFSETPFGNSSLSQGELGKLTGDCFANLKQPVAQQCPGCITGGLNLGTSLN